jgi:hypothetical protein
MTLRNSPLMFAGIGPGGQLAVHRRCGQRYSSRRQRIDRSHHGDEGRNKLVLFRAFANLFQNLQLLLEIADGNQFQDADGILNAPLGMIASSGTTRRKFPGSSRRRAATYR